MVNVIDDKTFRLNLATIAARELIGMEELKGHPDAKAIADICVGQAHTAISKAICSHEDVERAQDLVSALGPRFVQFLSTAVLLSSMQVSKQLTKYKQN